MTTGFDPALTMPRPPSCLCGECPKCVQRAYMRQWRSANPGYGAALERKRRAENGAQIRAQERERYRRDPAAKRARSAQWRADNPERMNELRRQDAQRNRERRRVYKIVARALASGRLTKPDVCQACGTTATGRRLHAHHHDYAKPLEVRWLCPDCHGLEHRNPQEEDPVR